MGLNCLIIYCYPFFPSLALFQNISRKLPAYAHCRTNTHSAPPTANASKEPVMTSHNATVISRPKIGICLSVIIMVSRKPLTHELSLMHRLGVHFRSPVSTPATKISKRPLSIFPPHSLSLFQRGREWIWMNHQMEAWERRELLFTVLLLKHDT